MPPHTPTCVYAWTTSKELASFESAGSVAYARSAGSTESVESSESSESNGSAE